MAQTLKAPISMGLLGDGSDIHSAEELTSL